MSESQLIDALENFRTILVLCCIATVIDVNLIEQLKTLETMRDTKVFKRVMEFFRQEVHESAYVLKNLEHCIGALSSNGKIVLLAL